MVKNQIVEKCRILLDAYKSGKLGYTKMPEESNPGFSENQKELRLAYFTLPMALNYQRDSYKMWEAALKTFNDAETKVVFEVNTTAKIDKLKLTELLTKYKLALQPNKHTATWQTICKTVSYNWGSLQNMIKACNYDYLELKEMIQKTKKKDFPYLSGPKIFNYWSFVLKDYGKVNLKNTDHIEIAPDTHIIQCSVVLGVITKEEAEKLSRDQISERWRDVLKDSEIDPIDMHPPLWFWSKNDFRFEITGR